MKLNYNRNRERSVKALGVNREYKDRLFRLLFGQEENKENMLSLYNALNHTAYTDPKDLTITTIDDVIYVGMKNDVSFILADSISLWEQQSSYNPNMPLRGFLYFGKLYNSYVERNRLNLYGSELLRIPSPKYVVLYNGTVEQPAEKKLKLSDAFVHSDGTGEFEWTATMVNINPGKNEELLSSCPALGDYMTLINEIRENRTKGEDVEDAIDHAVVSCIENNVLKDFLLKHRTEVLDVCLTEFNREIYEEGIRAEGRAEERARYAEERAHYAAEKSQLNAEILALKAQLEELQSVNSKK